MPHEWRQPTRARIGIPWWPWQARWRTRLGARFLLQFKQPLDKPSQGGIIEQRIPHCSTVERTIVRSARAHGARDQLGAQRIAFAPQEQRGALRQLRVLGAQLRRRQQRGGLASSVGHCGPKHRTGMNKKTPRGEPGPVQRHRGEPGHTGHTRDRYKDTGGSRDSTGTVCCNRVCVPASSPFTVKRHRGEPGHTLLAPPSVFEQYPLCTVCVPAPPVSFDRYYCTGINGLTVTVNTVSFSRGKTETRPKEMPEAILRLPCQTVPTVLC